MEAAAGGVGGWRVCVRECVGWLSVFGGAGPLCRVPRSGTRQTKDLFAECPDLALGKVRKTLPIALIWHSAKSGFHLLHNSKFTFTYFFDYNSTFHYQNIILRKSSYIML